MKYLKAILIGLLLGLIPAAIYFFSVGYVGSVISNKNCNGNTDPNISCYCKGQQITRGQDKYCFGYWEAIFTPPKDLVPVP